MKIMMTIREFTQKCREQQGKYRERMGEPMGVGPHLKKGTPQINMLVDGDKTGKNFVNEFTFNYAKRRVEKNRFMRRLTNIDFSTICCPVSQWHLTSFVPL